MIIVDTSLWVTHLREGNHHLEELLLDGEKVCHPFIVGELACGNIKNKVSDPLSFTSNGPNCLLG